MTHIVQFSGGKDSTALVLWAKEQGWPFTAVFCDTGWEHPLTYAYIQYINETQLGGKLVTVKSERFPNGMVDLVRHKGMVPRSRMRFCTEHLKIIPMRNYIATLDDDVTMYQGVRADESAQRAAMGCRVYDEQCDCWIERPLFDWSASRVFGLIQKHGVRFNELYKLGNSRVGCWPCVMSGVGEWTRLNKMMPETWGRARLLEDAANQGRAEGKCANGGGTVSVATFFKAGMIPERFCSGVSPRVPSEDRPETTFVYATVDDVKRYVEGPNDPRLWDDEPTRCLSVYNLCE